MIEWEIIPTEFHSVDLSEKQVDIIRENAKSCMDYFCNRLSIIDNWSIEDAEKIFSEIIDDMPVMSYRIRNNEFIIEYSKYADIILKDNITQIYREQKLSKIL